MCVCAYQSRIIRHLYANLMILVRFIDCLFKKLSSATTNTCSIGSSKNTSNQGMLGSSSLETHPFTLREGLVQHSLLSCQSIMSLSIKFQSVQVLCLTYTTPKQTGGHCDHTLIGGGANKTSSTGGGEHLWFFP